MDSSVDAESLMVVDVGSVSTRAIFFDLVDGQYRFIATGSAPTTAVYPYSNVSEGVRLALDQLQTITGRTFIDDNQQLIIPSPGDGTGVDRFAATISVGEPLKVVIVGLLEDVSLESARRLARSEYTNIVQAISLNDRRRTDTRINTILRARPDLIIAAGGTDGGASQSILSILESVGLAGYLMPEKQQLAVFFAGNSSLTEEIKYRLDNICDLHFAPNIRPTLELERLEAAETAFASLCTELRIRQFLGMEELKAWSGEAMLPVPMAFSRIIRFLSKALNSKKGVLGLDIGASGINLTTSIDGRSSIHVYPEFGLGSNLKNILEQVAIPDILRWVNEKISQETLQEYLIIKSMYPGSLPASAGEMSIEHAITRQMIQAAVKQASPEFPMDLLQISEDHLPLFEPILASGSVLSNCISPAESAMILLDGLQPVGVTTLILDQNHIAPAIGAAAFFSPMLAIQVMDSNSFLNLGTVIAPIANVKIGLPILRIKLTYESGHESHLELNQGSLEVLPLPYGQTARVQLQPLNKADIGMGIAGRGGSITVKGGALGVIFDGRGRPIRLPRDIERRLELQKKWLADLGGQ